MRALVQKLDSLLAEPLSPKPAKPKLNPASESHAAASPGVAQPPLGRRIPMDAKDTFTPCPWDDSGEEPDLLPSSRLLEYVEL